MSKCLPLSYPNCTMGERVGQCVCLFVFLATELLFCKKIVPGNLISKQMKRCSSGGGGTGSLTLENLLIPWNVQRNLGLNYSVWHDFWAFLQIWFGEVQSNAENKGLRPLICSSGKRCEISLLKVPPHPKWLKRRILLIPRIQRSQWSPGRLNNQTTQGAGTHLTPRTSSYLEFCLICPFSFSLYVPFSRWVGKRPLIDPDLIWNPQRQSAYLSCSQL